jgi:hypothetical protein
MRRRFLRLLTQQDLRRLTPRAPQPENTGAPQDVAHLIGPMGTRVVSGPNPGEIQAVLDYLASLGPAAEITGSEASSGSAA